MVKPVIFYFVHAHGNGHRATFDRLYPALSVYFNVIAVTTNEEIADHLYRKYQMEIIQLPPKYPFGYTIPAHTFSKAFEVTPYAVEPAERAKALSEAIIRYEPKAFYCDGVPEIAIMVRSMGVPVILVHLHGRMMDDPTQVFAHEMADHIIAHFPKLMEQKGYHFKSKTFYSGYISRFAGVKSKICPQTDADQVTVLMGFDNYAESVLKRITYNDNLQFTIIGNKRNYELGKHCRLLGLVKDVSEAITGDIVISAAGQNAIAELLSLKKKLILLPEPRPYEEQLMHAEILAENNIALLANENFSAEQWQEAISRAKLLTPASAEGLINRCGPEIISQQMKSWYA